MSLPIREEQCEGDRGNQRQLEPGVEEVGQPGQDHQCHGKEETNHHASTSSVSWAHYFQTCKFQC